ncbi:MAG: hypothetical protein KDK39_07195 [Leptospiraceae bacterium]|nr:hypothetical protein [Leptospiraceae bacterium]
MSSCPLSFRSFLAVGLMLLALPQDAVWPDTKNKETPRQTKSSLSLKQSRPEHITNQEPMDQKDPNQANPDKTPAKESAANSKQSQSKAWLIELLLTLGDGRQLKGELPVEAPEKFKLNHVKDGIQYQKEVHLADIERIEIERWSGSLVSSKKQGQLYEFRPSRIMVQLRGGYTLEALGDAFAFLGSFPVYNQNGRVQLFSFWLDLQKADGSWYTGMSGPHSSRKIPHKDVVRVLEFKSVKPGKS